MSVTVGQGGNAADGPMDHQGMAGEESDKSADNNLVNMENLHLFQQKRSSELCFVCSWQDSFPDFLVTLAGNEVCSSHHRYFILIFQ